jgi:DNA-directed RNA polymerase specialized sigma24 family protein
MRHRIIQEVAKANKLIHEEALEEHYSFEVSFSHEFHLITRKISEENQARLLKAFDLLTKRQKEAVFLRYYDNLEYQEIASIMQLKEVKYARTLIYRALDVLKASIRKLASVE